MKSFLLLLVICTQLHAAISTDKRYKISNYMGEMAKEVDLGKLMDEGGTQDLVKDGNSVLHLLTATYDFSVNGGASVADIGLGSSLPSKAIITRSYIDVVTAPVGPGATVAFKTESAGDVLAATAITSLGVGRVEGVSTGTAATMKKTTAARGVVMNVANSSLTAGKIRVYIQYVMSE